MIALETFLNKVLFDKFSYRDRNYSNDVFQIDL